MIHHTRLTFNEKLAPRKKGATRFIILHHSEVSSHHTIEDIHRWHQKKGWAGVGYHYFISKDGEIHEGRPVDTTGAHTYGQNQISIGICFEGHFDKENLTEKQENAGVKLLTSLSIAYPDAELRRHSDFTQSKTCPGKKFPYDRLLQRVATGISNLGLSTAVAKQHNNTSPDTPIAAKVKRLLITEFDLPPDEVVNDAKLRQDLDLYDLERLDFLIAWMNTFDIEKKDLDKIGSPDGNGMHLMMYLRTVGDIVELTERIIQQKKLG